MHEQAGSAPFRDCVAKGSEKQVRVIAGLTGARQVVESLGPVPERVTVENEARSRHDVGPIGGLSLLEQKPYLVFLALEPAQGQFGPGSQFRAEPGAWEHALHDVDGDQPPEGGVDTAGIPEIDLVQFGLDVFGNLAVGSLVSCQGQQAVARGLDQIGLPRGRHAEGADGGVPAEDARIVPAHRLLVPHRGEHATGCAVLAQKPERLAVTLLQHFAFHGSTNIPAITGGAAPSGRKPCRLSPGPPGCGTRDPRENRNSPGGRQPRRL